jgi:hypothetical protein
MMVQSRDQSLYKVYSSPQSVGIISSSKTDSDSSGWNKVTLKAMIHRIELNAIEFLPECITNLATP